MKIAVFDSAAFKFSRMLIDHWIAKGHDVQWEIGANPALAEWADLTYIDFIDNNCYCLFNGPGGDHEALNWQSYPKKRLAVRGIDIDIWMGRHRDPRLWNYVDDFITIAPYLYEMVEKEAQFPRPMHHLIRPGVELEKFPFRDKPRGFNIAMVTGNFWEMKQANEGYRIFDMLVRKYPEHPWKLHVRGEYNSREMEIVMKEHVIDSMGIRDKVQVYSKVQDMNEWYEPMDYILVPSYKEAFSYAAAEAMAKGIKPILNNWKGSTDIWPEKYIYSHLDEAVEMFMGEHTPLEYRKVIEERYDAKRMFADYDKLFGT